MDSLADAVLRQPENSLKDKPHFYNASTDTARHTYTSSSYSDRRLARRVAASSAWAAVRPSWRAAYSDAFALSRHNSQLARFFESGVPGGTGVARILRGEGR